MVPVDCAEELGTAIIAAARGEPYGNAPGWWHDFMKQYEAGEWRRKPQQEADDDWAETQAAVDRPRPVSLRPPRPPQPPAPPRW